MRRLLIPAVAITLLLGWAAYSLAQVGGSPNLIYCNRISASNLSAGTTEIVAGVAGRNIHVCGWTINSNTVNPTLEFAVGTGPTCTNPLPNIPTYFLGGAGTITVNHLETAFVSLPAGLSVCATVTGGGVPSVSLSFYYAQF